MQAEQQLDLDNKESKAKEIQQLEARNRVEKFIVSNPSFEVWYLLHFEYSTRSYIDAGAAIKELKKHHPGYEKTSDMYPLLKEKMGEAIANAEKLEAYYTSSYWKEDFQLDEEGKLPADLKRGVLSEDGISSVLDDYHELMTFL